MVFNLIAPLVGLGPTVIKDEESIVVVGPQSINFSGESISVTGSGNHVTVEISGGGGGGVGIPTGFASGRYYSNTLAASATTAAITANTLYFVPFFIGVTTTWKEIGIEVTANVSSTNARLGIYGSSSGLPGDLILDAGTVSTGSNGVKAIAINQTLTPGMYFLAVVGDGTPTLRFDSSVARFGAGAASMSVSMPNAYSRSFTYGTLPASAGTLTDIVSGQNPRTFLRWT